MGLDLAICPIKWQSSGWWLGFDRLGFERDYGLFEQIMNRGRQNPEDNIQQVCRPKEIADDVKFDWYGDEGIEKKTTHDPYGDPLTFCYASEFHKINTDHCGDWNKAVIEFLKTLPIQTPIVLWWH